MRFISFLISRPNCLQAIPCFFSPYFTTKLRTRPHLYSFLKISLTQHLKLILPSRTYSNMRRYTYESSYDSDNETTGHGKHGRLFWRERPMHDVLGGGKVADVLLWRNKKVSAALLIGVTVIWLLFEVVEYNFVTLLCHISITAMLVTFVWYRTAEYMNWNPPNIPELLLKHEAALKDVASTFHRRSNQLMTKFVNITSGRDVAGFFLTIFGLFILSLIGSCFSFLNFLFLGFLCLLTLPYLYDRYENEVDVFAGKLGQKAKKSFKNFDSNVLNKIPRGPVKDKKAL